MKFKFYPIAPTLKIPQISFSVLAARTNEQILIDIFLFGCGGEYLLTHLVFIKTFEGFY